MEPSQELKERIEVLAQRQWDLPDIKKRFDLLVEKGIPQKPIDREEILRDKGEILNRVQQRAEEYCYLTRSCAKGSALALLEQFGLGNMEIVKAMAPFPGLAMSGGICGPVAGGLAVMGLYFSDPDLSNFENPRHYLAAREFLKRFKKTLGSLSCLDIQEQVLGGRFDPFASPEEREGFNATGAREKCPVAPGLGARIAAEIIIESLAKKK
ncbi:MAG: C-GCAxxG-C-C family protein [Thermodesulfobacteriota bacterium]